MKKLILVVAVCLALSLFAGCKEEKTKDKKIENITREETIENDAPVSGEEDVEKSPQDEKEPEKEPEDEIDEKAPVTHKTLADIRAEIINAVSASESLELDATAMSNLYGINPGNISDAAGFVVMEGTFPHEVVMIKAKDASAAAEVERLLKAKHQSFVEQSKGYDPQNYALAQKCKVEKNGNYVSMFLTPDFETMKSIYRKYIN